MKRMLSADDRSWLEDKFTRLHERIDEVEEKLQRKGSDIHRIDLALTEHMGEQCRDVLTHEEKCHNPAKTWGIISAMVGGLTAVIELGKWIVKRGGP